MANRTRPIVKRFCVTAEEQAAIEQKMAQAGIKNFADYIRAMALKGYVIEVDFSAVKELAKEVGGISRNINQIAKRVNATGNIYKDDMDEIKERMADVWRLLRFTLSSQR